MRNNINLRVFRRNSKNIILLWDNNRLTEDTKIFLLPEKKELFWKAFVPLNRNKFQREVQGVVIPQKENNISPEEEVLIGVEINGKLNEIKVRPCEKNIMIVKLFGYDAVRKRWYPFQGEFVNGTFVLLTKNITG
jgi:hypothetical protein